LIEAHEPRSASEFLSIGAFVSCQIASAGRFGPGACAAAANNIGAHIHTVSNPRLVVAAQVTFLIVGPPPLIVVNEARTALCRVNNPFRGAQLLVVQRLDRVGPTPQFMIRGSA
jgi:hypothetical protein